MVRAPQRPAVDPTKERVLNIARRKVDPPQKTFVDSLSEVRVTKSMVDQIPNFEQAVVDYCAARMAARGKIGVPAVMAPHPLIEACVRVVRHPHNSALDEFVPNYVIWDDTSEPTQEPPLSLEQKKAQLAGAVLQAEQAAQEAAWPVLRRRLEELRYQDAISAQQSRAARGESAAATEQEASTVAKFMGAQQRLQDISRYAAHKLAEIHDLTEATIDAWQVGEF